MHNPCRLCLLHEPEPGKVLGPEASRDKTGLRTSVCLPLYVYFTLLPNRPRAVLI